MTTPIEVVSLVIPVKGRGTTGTMGTTATRTRRSQAVQSTDLHPWARPLIRRFGVRVSGGPPPTAGIYAALGMRATRESRPTKEYPRGQEVYVLRFAEGSA